KDNAIAECELVLVDKAGKVKDANYDYENADVIVEVMKEYPAMLVKAGSVEEFEKLDAISGATVTFKEFALAAKDALAKAK
ncbi:MAG: FMN-binding protein, partial [Synergistaceae bacterium]|nr:FMN-binding protein [Synergistaceae bacterium]